MSCFSKRVRGCLEIINKGHKKQRVVNGNIYTLYDETVGTLITMSKRIAQESFIIIVTHSNPLSLMLEKE